MERLTAGALVSFLLYALYVAGAVGSLGSLFGVYQEAVGAARRTFDLLETESAVCGSAKAAPASASPVRGEVELDNVSFHYNTRLARSVSRRVAADRAG